MRHPAHQWHLGTYGMQILKSYINVTTGCRLGSIEVQHTGFEGRLEGLTTAEGSG